MIGEVSGVVRRVRELLGAMLKGKLSVCVCVCVCVYVCVLLFCFCVDVLNSRHLNSCSDCQCGMRVTDGEI